MVHYRQIRSRRARGKAVYAAARTTKGGKGPIKKRPAYKKAMKKKGTRRKSGRPSPRKVAFWEAVGEEYDRKRSSRKK